MNRFTMTMLQNTMNARKNSGANMEFFLAAYIRVSHESAVAQRKSVIIAGPNDEKVKWSPNSSVP